MTQVLGLLGQAGVGKDTVAEIIAPVHLVEIGGEFVDIRTLLAARSPVQLQPNPPERALRGRAVQIALADPLKEYCLKVYDFTLEQLWGPSAERNKPDERYPRSFPEHRLLTGVCTRCGVDVNAQATSYGPCVTYLTAREALQQLGTEWGRACFDDTWVRLAMRRAEQLTAKRINPTTHGKWLVEQHDLVVISDCRFLNEARALSDGGHEVWQVKRPSDKSAAMYSHASETEQVKAADEIAPYLSMVIVNDGTHVDLRAQVAAELQAGGL